jgi:hypothetical protein
MYTPFLIVPECTVQNHLILPWLEVNNCQNMITHYSKINIFSETLLVLYSTQPLQDQRFLMQLTDFLKICMLELFLIGQLWRGYYAI